MTSITLDLTSTRELRLAAQFLNHVAEEREARSTLSEAIDAAETETVRQVDTGNGTATYSPGTFAPPVVAPVTAVAAGTPLKGPDEAAGAALVGEFVLKDSSGVAVQSHATPELFAAAISEVFGGAPSGESLDNFFAVNAPEMKRLPKALLDKVTVAYGTKAASFKVAPPAGGKKRTGGKKAADAAAAASTPATSPETAPTATTASPSEGAKGGLFAEVGVDNPKPIASTPPAPPAPVAGSEDVEKAVHGLMMAFIKEVGYAKGVQFMKRFSADRFSQIGKEHYPSIGATLGNPALRAALIAAPDSAPLGK